MNTSIATAANLPDPETLQNMREDLAATFRYFTRLGMHESVANHFSLTVSADGRQFLMNPRGRHFSRVRASDLQLIDADDPQTMQRANAPRCNGMVHPQSHPPATTTCTLHSAFASALRHCTVSACRQLHATNRPKHHALF